MNTQGAWDVFKKAGVGEDYQACKATCFRVEAGRIESRPLTTQMLPAGKGPRLTTLWMGRGTLLGSKRILLMDKWGLLEA